MKSSLDVLSTATGRTVAVMGDMYELGDKENELHYNTGAHAAEIGIDVICCIGELSHHAYEGAKACAKSSAVLYFKTKQDFLGKIRNVVKKDDTILVKASHGMEFPEIIDVLRQMKF
jgi:UDP-N-acetylmuramoyl-tripeptide--D-alanyl-D-alanine ligase